MSGFSHVNLQQAVFGVLHGDATLMGLISGVYDVVPQGTAFPYVVISGLAAEDESTRAADGLRVRVTLDVFSREAGQKQAAGIMDRVYQLLHRANPSVSGQTLVESRYVSSGVALQNDGVTQKGRMVFEVVTRV